MTPRGGPTLDFSLFGRYFLDLAVFYPGAFLCLAPLWEHVKAPRRTAVLTAALVTVICLAAAALCAIFELDSNILLLPTLLAAFWLLRWRGGPEVSVSQTAFLFAVSCVMMAVCTLLSAVLNARAEVGNDAPACLVSTSLIKLGLSAVLCIIFWFTAVQWSRWLLQEYRGEAFWQSAWPLPTIYAAFLVFCMPLDPAVVLINRLMIISVLAVSISLLGIFLLLYEMYQVAREYTRSAQLDRENQLLAVESRRYTELRAYMEQTRHLRHDFRQHLHVIAGLTEAGQVDELKNYLHQYESELSEERPTLCANPAVDALAGHYDHEAHSLGVPVDWRLELPRQLAIPEARAEAASAQGGKLTELYGVTNGGADAGYVMKISASGSQGTIVMMVGVDATKAITGISVVSHAETSGIGTKVVGNEPNAAGVPVLDQFIGMSGAGSLVVGKNITAVSGATVSTKGINMGANAALAVAEVLG